MKLLHSKLIVIVGIPGVGKTTVIEKLVEYLTTLDIKSNISVFGSVMLDEAKKIGIKNRDELRTLSVKEQKKLQISAANKISNLKYPFIFVDTHLFITTSEGYCPGLPFDILNSLSPDQIILVEAKPEEIVERRNTDITRKRDNLSIDEIIYELNLGRSMLSSSAVISGATIKTVNNNNDDIENTIMEITNSLGVMK
tara:strand:- start:28 stop:618 length:591 start_codon:yes stop_codon:yes gene_type:complete